MHALLYLLPANMGHGPGFAVALFNTEYPAPVTTPPAQNRYWDRRHRVSFSFRSSGVMLLLLLLLMLVLGCDDDGGDCDMMTRRDRDPMYIPIALFVRQSFSF